ncbi:MAG TPA: DNA topoisomerase IB [Polyangia bacterium]
MSKSTAGSGASPQGLAAGPRAKPVRRGRAKARRAAQGEPTFGVKLPRARAGGPLSAIAPIATTAKAAKAAANPVRAAKVAKLKYVSDDRPGIQRTGKPGHFRYTHPSGRKVTDPATLARIASLAIPPAWTDVWICPIAQGHIQATARDAKGRKQYRYHPRWRKVRDESKFGRMIEFAEALPRIREAVNRDLRQPHLSRQKVLAGVVRLLERTSIRVGNDEYARSNQHYGITTFEDRHARVAGSTIRFVFRGKSGKAHEIDLQDPTLAKLVRRCRDIPGQRLFQFVDEDNRRRSIGSGDVNKYLREVSGADFTAKDFRTWAGTNMVAATLAACEEPRSAAAGNKEILAAIDSAAARLGNTRAVCRSSYVHPAVIDAFLAGRLRAPGRVARPRAASSRSTRLAPLERATLRVLRAAQKTARRSG